MLVAWSILSANMWKRLSHQSLLRPERIRVPLAHFLSLQNCIQIFAILLETALSWIYSRLADHVLWAFLPLGRMRPRRLRWFQLCVVQPGISESFESCVCAVLQSSEWQRSSRHKWRLSTENDTAAGAKLPPWQSHIAGAETRSCRKSRW